MAKTKRHPFRVGKIEVIKAVARRPKGLFRPSQTHQDATVYVRRKARQNLRRELNGGA
jgi:hypothetical protein